MSAIQSAIVIAIDGPSASGKSTVSRLVAEALNFYHVDTGSMYRAFTWKVLKEATDARCSAAVLDLMRRVQYECDFVAGDDGPTRLRNRLDGEDPGADLRSPRVEESVSVVAAIPQVREWLVEKQRQLARLGDLVVEGRDIGTVVFPDTPYKFYLDADPDVRARRRAADQAVAGGRAEIGEVGQAIAERDRMDSTRSVAPLKIAEDAVRLDTSTQDARHVADVVLKHIRSRHLMRK
ncbi:MAG: (d)CMP kinase [Verrucomicrobia bacterium]|nr:(d)CMP kinase [Verrucomicrobiota bacterium]